MGHSMINSNGTLIELKGDKVYINGSKVEEDGTYKRRTVNSFLLGTTIGGVLLLTSIYFSGFVVKCGLV